MNKHLKRTLSVLGIIFLFIAAYVIIYNCIYQLPLKPKNSTELDLSFRQNETMFLDDSSYENYVIDRSKAKDYINQYVVNSTYSLTDEVKMSYNSYVTNKSNNTIVISHGFTEWKYKYEEAIYYFLNMNYNVYIADHRGHGESTREVDDLSKVHIDSMHTYVDDLNSFINNKVKAERPNDKIILFAHSMGGGIATMLAQNYPDTVDLLILSAPMMKADLGMPECLASIVINFMYTFNKKGYVLGYGPYEPNYEFSIEDSTTSCYARGYYNSDYSNPYNQCWGPDWSWTKAVIDGTHEIQAKKNIKKINIPVLLFQAGKDSLVDNTGQNQLNKYCKDITMYTVSNSRHEIWNEKNEILIPYYSTIFNFINNKL